MLRSFLKYSRVMNYPSINNRCSLKFQINERRKTKTLKFFSQKIIRIGFLK